MERGSGGDRLSRGRAGSKAWADGTELIKELPRCSHLSGSTRTFEVQVKKALREYWRRFLVRFPFCSLLQQLNTEQVSV